ncbi:hypothetical protein MYU51_019781 [Penicillium brevicompactum]|uniref:uncharacterized protein n=1 Tax=Penicillium brevicompactum TaxID=5074 RepID=UPI0025416314|nr:uncharacterized protein N7506_000407 [Penicillium brevicompactum]KAJ5347154.1 hypothetical protein N7506_000407 [Penicillium brevicompactum]
MADVRSLLRNELASRKGTSQPNTTGNRVTKKRKVDSSDGVVRKKLRATELDAFQSVSDAPSTDHTTADEGSEQLEEDAAGPAPAAEPNQQSSDFVANLAEQQTTIVSPQPQSTSVDEDEWAAFEREVAEPSRVPNAPAAVAAEATISAAPITAEEIAEQQKKAKQSAAHTREAELEGEREDAARLMEDELDEMEQLEERVRKLKQQREALRKTRAEDQTATEATSDAEQQDAESESEDGDDEEWDDWRFK